MKFQIFSSGPRFWSAHGVLAALFFAGLAPVQSCPSSGGSGGTAGSGGSAGTLSDAGDVVSCQNDPRVFTYSPNMVQAGSAGLVRMQLVSADPAPPAKGTNTWIVRVLDSSGNPLSGVTLTPVQETAGSDPYMPDHGHTSSVLVNITANTDGTFTVSPLYFFMAGVWQMGIVVKLPDGRTDTVKFYFCVEG